jgi:hypothetical protein
MTLFPFPYNYVSLLLDPTHMSKDEKDEQFTRLLDLRQVTRCIAIAALSSTRKLRFRVYLCWRMKSIWESRFTTFRVVNKMVSDD